MSKVNIRFLISLILGIFIYIALGFITDALHDLLFLRFTSIQDGVVSCSGFGAARECITENSVLAYNNRFVSIIGNIFAIATTVIRIYVGYLVVKILNPEKI